MLSEAGHASEDKLRCFLIELVALAARDLHSSDVTTRLRAERWFTAGEEQSCPTLGLHAVCSALKLDPRAVRQGALAGCTRQVRAPYRGRRAA